MPSNLKMACVFCQIQSIGWSRHVEIVVWAHLGAQHSDGLETYPPVNIVNIAIDSWKNL